MDLMAVAHEGNTPQKRQRRSDRTPRTSSIEECLVNCLVQAVDEEKHAKNGFKNEAWKAVYTALSEKFSTFTFTMSAIKSNDEELKKRFWEFQRLRENSRFGWNEEKQVLTAHDYVWEDYLIVKIIFNFCIHIYFILIYLK
jgi:hypothetical protein